MKRFCLWVFSASICCAAYAQRPAPPLALEVRQDSVRVSGVTPGADLAFFAFSREPQGFHDLLVRREAILHDQDRDGVIDYPIVPSVPRESFLAAVDLSDGRTIIGSPEGFEISPVALPGNAIHGSNGLLNRLEKGGARLEMFIARPGVGAWGISISDGGTFDAGPPGDRKVEVDPSLAYGIDTATNAPANFRANDILVGVDPSSFEYLVARVGGGRQ